MSISLCVVGDGQVDFDEFMTILGPKLLSSEAREGFHGSTIDSIFWQVRNVFGLMPCGKRPDFVHIKNLVHCYRTMSSG